MYESLRDLSPELLLPGVGTIDLDTVTLLNSNPRFIEAYMVGLNHELASELLWREFPSDTRASVLPPVLGHARHPGADAAAAADPRVEPGGRARRELRRRARTSCC